MDDYAQKRARNLLVVFGILALALVVISVVQLHANRSVQQYSVPASFAQASPYGSNSLVFSNGNALETYNYATGNTTPISGGAVGLNTIDTVSSSGSYVVFHDQQLMPSGGLAGQLKAQGQDPTADKWFLFNASGRSFKALPQNTVIAKVYNGNLYALQFPQSGTGEYITVYQLPGMQSIKTVDISGSINFYVAANGFVLQSPDNQIFFTQDGVVSQTLLSSAILAGVTADGHTALAVTTRNGVRSLTKINLSNDADTIVASNVSNVPAWSDSGNVLYTDNQGNVFDYDLTTSKSERWRLNGNLATAESKLGLNALVSPEAGIANDGSGHYYLIGRNLAQPKPIH